MKPDEQREKLLKQIINIDENWWKLMKTADER